MLKRVVQNSTEIELTNTTIYKKKKFVFSSIAETERHDQFSVDVCVAEIIADVQ